VKRNAKSLPPLPERAVKMLARLKRVRGMSDDEKSVHALGLAAAPEERWELAHNHVLLARQVLKLKKSDERIARQRR